MRIRDDQFDALEAATDEVGQEGGPERCSLAGTDVQVTVRIRTEIAAASRPPLKTAGLLKPLMQCLRNAAAPLRDRNHRRPPRWVYTLVVKHHLHRALANLRRELVRRLAHTGSTFSGVGASGAPGAVHLQGF